MVEGTLVVVVMGCESSCRDVDEARCLRCNIQLNRRLNNFFIADCSPLGIAMRGEDSLATHEPAQLPVP